MSHSLLTGLIVNGVCLGLREFFLRGMTETGRWMHWFAWSAHVWQDTSTHASTSILV